MSEYPEDELLPAGEYLLALVWFGRRTTERGEYLRCRFGVCAGPRKGAGFFCPVSLNTGNAVVERIWALWMEQVGCTQEVDLADDSAIARHFKGRVFKAVLTAKQLGDRQVNDIKMRVYPSRYTAEDRRLIAEWEQEWTGREWRHTDPTDPGPQDTDAPPTSQAQPQWSEGSPFADDDGDDFQDDDIPF